jgi:hypothetical protein
MPVLFVLLERLIAALQKTVTFRAKQPCFASKPHPPAHHKAITWVFVVPMPLPFFFLVSFSLFLFPCRSPFSVLRSPFSVLHPSSLLFMWGFVGGFL